MELYRVGNEIFCDQQVPAGYRELSKVAHAGIICTMPGDVTVSGIAYILQAVCVTKELNTKFRRPLEPEKPVQRSHRSSRATRSGLAVMDESSMRTIR